MSDDRPTWAWTTSANENKSRPPFCCATRKQVPIRGSRLALERNAELNAPPAQSTLCRSIILVSILILVLCVQSALVGFV